MPSPYGWLLITHVGAALIFLGAHVPAFYVAFRVRGLRNPPRIARLLNVSRPTVGILHTSLLVVLVTGLVLTFRGSWQNMGWPWAALAVVVGLWAVMYFRATAYYDQVRAAVGAPRFYQEKGEPKPPTAPPERVEQLVSSSRPFELATLGLLGFFVLLWLMTSKPF